MSDNGQTTSKAHEPEIIIVGDVTKLGALALALSKAQMSFPSIPRTRNVNVRMKTGGAYDFNYAPLDTVLACVRAPLGANGLAVSQLLGANLVTLLLHADGCGLMSVRPIPPAADAQQLGSHVTYLRRYAVQAILGIASEEDDDGNAASGNHRTIQPRQPRATVSPEAPPVVPPITAEKAGRTPAVAEPPGISSDTITDAQKKALHAGMNEIGLKSKAAKLDFANEIIFQDPKNKRSAPITSSLEMTKAEASKVLDAIADAMRPEPEEPVREAGEEG